MAFVEMICSCDANLQMDIEDTDVLMTYAARFANAHVACGFMTDPEPERPTLRVRRIPAEEIEDDDE